jgi:hypothetical protein
MIKMSTVVFLLAFTSGCSGQIDCDEYSIALSNKFESELFKDKETDRGGFYRLATQMQAELGNDSEAFAIINSDELSPTERDKALEKYGPLLLMIAISSGNAERVKFYLQNGVDSLKYHEHLGVIVLDLVEIQDRELLSIFKSFFDDNEIESVVFSEIELYYHRCL